jgi:two-component system sensor histidine kinase PilS (NtrC family)
MIDQSSNGKSTRTDGSGTPDAGSLLQAHASLTRQERTAALRVLTGRVAHQMRNPLAAIQAACTSLRMELPDPDHRERLDLILHEVGRVLALISAEVQAFTQPAQTPQRVDLVAETEEIIGILGHANPQAPGVTLRANGRIDCTAVRSDLRIALYSLLGYALEVPGVGTVEIGIDTHADRAQITFRLVSQDGAGDPLAAIPPCGASPILSDDIGLYIAERFARDLGGRLSRQTSDGDAQIVTLDLPCDHV